MHIAKGKSLFESNILAVQLFSKYVTESWLPLASSTQLVESKVKDTTFYALTGKKEQNISKLATMHSTILPYVTTAITESDLLKNKN